MSTLRLCPRCRRHVRAAHDGCPFCAVRLPAIAAVGIVCAAIGAGACESKSAAPSSDAAVSTPATTAPSPGSATPPSTDTMRRPAAVYGGPPRDRPKPPSDGGD